MKSTRGRDSAHAGCETSNGQTASVLHYEYCVSIPAARVLGDYTPRLLPRHPIASVPLEAPEILWQR